MKKIFYYWLFHIIFLIAIGFWFYLSFLFFNNGEKTFKDIDFVNGEISSYRIIKHSEGYNRAGKKRLHDVLVFKVDGCNDEFGIENYKNEWGILGKRIDNYNKVKKILTSSNSNQAEIYYDKYAKRIEEGVTLHLYDLKINNESIISFKKITGDEKKGSLIFLIIGFVFLLIYILVARNLKTKLRSASKQASDKDENG